MGLLQTAGFGAVPTGLAHGTVTAVAEGKPFEITTLRRDVETFGRHAVVAFTQLWEEDAARRDFTMNALYADESGTVFDYAGGIADLKAGRVRFVGDAGRRIREDYLRSLRLFRFHAWYGKGEIDRAALAAAAEEEAGLKSLSGGTGAEGNAAPARSEKSDAVPFGHAAQRDFARDTPPRCGSETARTSDRPRWCPWRAGSGGIAAGSTSAR